MITINLTESQADNLMEFFEFSFIPSVRQDDDIDNINYLVDMCDIYKALKEQKKERDQNAR